MTVTMEFSRRKILKRKQMKMLRKKRTSGRKYRNKDLEKKSKGKEH